MRFDAWKSDFWNNAFEPFIVAALETIYFKQILRIKRWCFTEEPYKVCWNYC